MGGEKKERRKKEEQTDNELPTVGVCKRVRDGGGCQTEWTNDSQEHPVVGAKSYKRGEGHGKPRRLGTPRTPIPLDLWK